MRIAKIVAITEKRLLRDNAKINRRQQQQRLQQLLTKKLQLVLLQLRQCLLRFLPKVHQLLIPIELMLIIPFVKIKRL